MDGDAKVIDPRHLALWDALGQYGASGAVAAELAAMQLPGFISESSVRKTLRGWKSQGYVASAQDNRSERYSRVDVLGIQHLREP